MKSQSTQICTCHCYGIVDWKFAPTRQTVDQKRCSLQFWKVWGCEFVWTVESSRKRSILHNDKRALTQNVVRQCVFGEKKKSITVQKSTVHSLPIRLLFPPLPWRIILRGTFCNGGRDSEGYGGCIEQPGGASTYGNILEQLRKVWRGLIPTAETRVPFKVTWCGIHNNICSNGKGFLQTLQLHLSISI
jgi:hypothetical protein